jgi:hypothetical protein
MQWEGDLLASVTRPERANCHAPAQAGIPPLESPLIERSRRAKIHAKGDEKMSPRMTARLDGRKFRV